MPLPQGPPCSRGVGHRATVIGALVLTLGMLAVPAQGITLGQAKHRLAKTEDRIRDHRRTLIRLRRQMDRLVKRENAVRRNPPGSLIQARQKTTSGAKARELLKTVRLAGLGDERLSLRKRMRGIRHRIEVLGRAASRVDDLIWRIRPIGLCPVRGPSVTSDDFGAARWYEGKYHAHQGNDISAAFGTPIIAPFDGTAQTAPNALGGLAVKVHGQAGYVYNAHLSSYGNLGAVQAGDVIGYVGATGNAQGPHDHFEWHPGGGPAVDPHALLLQVC
jgi:murein DD-endopeptidase MepM/ murein hydrolase activator NlpD